MINDLLNNAPLFILVCARCLGLILILPMFSMRTVNFAAKVALSGYMAYFCMFSADFSKYGDVFFINNSFSLYFLILVLGEALIGVIIGFFVSIIFGVFSTAGQFFSFQMGFSAASAYDALSQVENPLMGQFFNLAAMLVFMQTHWFQKLFLGGLSSSFESLNVFELILRKNDFVMFFLKGLTNLFADALIIALPIMCTLVLITVCTGLLSKAAPQMNLLSEGFPVMILLSFLVLVMVFPAICDFFVRSFNTGINDLIKLIKK